MRRLPLLSLLLIAFVLAPSSLRAGWVAGGASPG
jgi:hypothetical protein